MPRHKFYNSSVWKRLRRYKLNRSPLCEKCQRPATDVDHKISINSGGSALDLENIQALCHACHSRKTIYLDRMQLSKIPVKGVDSKTGMPLDPEHWWKSGS